MLRRLILPVVLSAALFSGAVACSEDPSDYVNPLIGTAYTGHTFPGAAYPFGVMQPGPNTGNFDWEHCSGYNNDDPQIWGFAQNHINGTGCPDLGDIVMMPYSVATENYRSAWDRESVVASPGYYSVRLTDNKVVAEMTCTPHVAIHRYSYDSDRNLYIDLQSSQVGDIEDYNAHVLECETDFEDACTLTGHEYVKGWVTRHLYFVIKFNAPVQRMETLQGDPSHKAPKYSLSFESSGKPLLVKVATSTVSVEAAKANLQAEVPSWDFDKVAADARAEWNRYFNLIKVEGDPEQLTSFYTSFYHLLIQPNNIADVDGGYRGEDDEIRYSENGKYYSTFSLWDTFRAAHPFYSLMLPQANSDMVASMLRHADIKGFLPIWHLYGKENYCMIGNHAVPVVVDACLRDYPDIDQEKAYAAVKRSLTEEHYRADWGIYDKYGYYPFDIIVEEDVSRTMECGYDDYCAAQLAKKLGYSEDYDFFMKRSSYWKNLFDPQTRLMRARDSEGNWRTPFDPFHLSHGGDIGGDYTEGNAWQYTWHIQQDIEGLVEMMGGRDAFLSKLDSLFILETRTDQTGEGFVGDVTGLIGQYAHGNEPSHHVIYLYSMLGENSRTAELVREVFDKFYKARPDGLCGNDDCGQMSAWYIFSAMGFYPVNTVSGEYILGAPQIPSITLSLPNGKSFKVIAEGLSKENKYVGSVSLNGKAITDNRISYEQIMAGGELRFVMTQSDLGM